MIRITQVVFTLFVSAGLSLLPAQTAQTPNSDNTKVNKRDRAKGAVTADQQKENKTDRELAKEIRQAVVSDKSLSTYAHNVKIIATNGTITLKGPVHSEDEKKTIVAKATEIAGASKVKDEISVKGDSKGDAKTKTEKP